MKTVLNIGVRPANGDTLNRKIRITNLISLITIVFMLFFVPMAISFCLYKMALLNAIFLGLSVFNFYLHHKGLHQTSFWVSVSFGVFYFIVGTITYGLEGNTHFFLLIMCLIAIVLFDNPVVLKAYIGTVILVFFCLLMYMKNRPGTINFNESQARVQEMVNVSNLLSLFLITIIFFLFFKREQVLFQKMILDQKKLVQEKQSEIIDSITYAKRIQEAILPPENYWHKYLPDSFILYKPKDIVAGDFYWMETLRTQKGEFVFFAVADCTGHGVPGAMVSVVCNNALNRSVLEFKLEDPGKILDKTRELVIETFGKSDKEVKDGMDISLCCFDSSDNSVKWSGANNPLWYFQNGNLRELKPDKQPIGSYSAQKPFTTHTLKLQKGDTLYLFSDGYADQFGGPKGKKFKYKQLQEELAAMQNQSLHNQKQKLEHLFENWKNSLEQIDDVCIIGIKI